MGHTLQMDGGFSGYADENGPNEIHGACQGGSHKLVRRETRNKIIAAICKFLLKDVICEYGCVGKIVADGCKRVKLSLTTV